MNNREIISAIVKIAKFKLLKKECDLLRKNILGELSRRKKDKINLGGPTHEDYVKRNPVDQDQYSPEEVYQTLLDDGMDVDAARKVVFAVCQSGVVSTKQIKGLGIEGKLEPRSFKTITYMSYRISSDEKNALRGIDL